MKSFISYAQNFEDVMLWRALKDVDKGFYIDIGAQDPVVDSVSLAFYEHAWRGLHVEPTEQYSAKLRQARPDEVVEQVAIGADGDSLKFYEFSGTGLSTSDDTIAKAHIDSGYQAICLTVPMISLDALLNKYGERPVNWMKIDVEGFEKSVIESWVESPVRPWILVIESTRPLSQEQSHEAWEELVLMKGYQFAYFDGLNRFYVHDSKSELLRAFNCPPNVFDGFVLGGKSSQSFCQLVLGELHQTQAMHRQSEALLSESLAQRQALEERLIAVYSSTSWRITKPLRWMVLQASLARTHGVKARSRALLLKCLSFTVGKASTFVSPRPVLRGRCIGLLKALGAYDLARKAFSEFQRKAVANRAKEAFSEQRLTMRGRDIYFRLKKNVRRAETR